MCPALSLNGQYVSTSSHRIYTHIIPRNIEYVDCNSANLIYLITCDKCSIGYVGETMQKLRDRISHHRSCIKHPEKDQTCRRLSDHFSKGCCKGSTFTVNIIEKLPGDGRDSSGVEDLGTSVDRRAKEKHHMPTLRTVCLPIWYER